MYVLNENNKGVWNQYQGANEIFGALHIANMLG